MADKIVSRLQQGQRIALVSDAGTPAISDPGARIVAAVRAAGLRVVPLPGPSAAITALSASGLLNDRFHFIGFLPNKARQRELALQKLSHDNATLVFYEAPHRIEETVADLLVLLEPQREIVVARELTKMFEQIVRMPLTEAPEWFAGDENRKRGEFVLIVSAPPTRDTMDAETERVLKLLLDELPTKQAAKLAAEITGHSKNELYELALAFKNAPI